MTVTCPRCEAEATSGSLFCSSCGGPLPDPSDERVDVILVATGEQKIGVIRQVVSLAGDGLAAAKTLVESAPQPLLADVSRRQAEHAKSRLEALGATVQIAPRRP